MASVRRLKAHEWRAYRDVRLRALGDSPNAFGSTIEVEGVKPDEYWAERLSAAATSQWNLPLAADTGDELVGLVWGWIDPLAPETAHVYQMWVAPNSRGQGCGSMLLDALITWAREANAQSVVLRATCGDTPAMRLYTRAGFKPEGEPQPLRPGSTVLAQPMRLVL